MRILKNTATRYGLVSMCLHWLMALIIFGLLILGWYMTELPISLKKLKLYGWHKEWGIVIFILVIMRGMWRIKNPPPPLPNHMPRWQQWAAKSVHFAFYGLMLVMPISGWMLSSAAGLPVSIFGLITLPDIIAANEYTRVLLTEFHHILGYIFVLLIFAHVGAALQHHFIYKDDILRRML